MARIVPDFEFGAPPHLAAATPGAKPPQRPRSPFLWVDGDPRPAEVLRAFERSGGVQDGDEIARMLRRRHAQPISTLARWIVDAHVVSFAWRGGYLLPVFQFDLRDATVRPRVAAVLDALGGALKDIDLAAWFALPHELLDGAAPVDVIDRDLHAVVDAARAERRPARN
ncbi:MAG: hypothetical protein JO090_10130 [Rhizobacter sp.]|nr:hypothetical protein [Rhizobacter sp.]